MMKFTLTLIALTAAVSAQNVEWNECQQNCLDEGGSTACTTAWNETDCFCSTEQFATDVRHCFYENSCWSDIMPFYEAREERCGDLAEDVSFEGRPGMGGGNATSSAAASASGASESASATSSSAASEAISSTASVSASVSESAGAAASSGASNAGNGAMGLAPSLGSATIVSGLVAVVGVVFGGALLA